MTYITTQMGHYLSLTVKILAAFEMNTTSGYIFSCFQTIIPEAHENQS